MAKAQTTTETARPVITPSRASKRNEGRALSTDFSKLPSPAGQKGKAWGETDGDTFDGEFKGVRVIPKTKLGKPCHVGVFADLGTGDLFSVMLGGKLRQVFVGSGDMPSPVVPGMSVRVTRNEAGDKDTGKGNPMKDFTVVELT